MWVRTLMAVAAVLAVSCSEASAQRSDDERIVLSLPTYERGSETRAWTVTDSAWGFVVAFNTGLAGRLRECAGDNMQAIASLELFPQRFSTDSVRAIEALARCGVAQAQGDPRVVRASLWTFVTRGAPLPTPLQRARAIVFRRSAFTPDYGATLWDLERPRFRSAIFTWGPFHATVGDGCTLRRVLRRVDANAEGRLILDEAFANEPDALRSLMAEGQCNEQNSRRAVDAIFADAERKEAFRSSFNVLADHELVRNQYDLVFLGPRNPRETQFREYYALYAAVDVTPTPTDFAFILDHALAVPNHEPDRMARLTNDARRAGLRTNAQVRRFISQQYLAPERQWVTQAATRSFRRGRDVAYFIDAVGVGDLTPEERSDWIAHSRLRASNVGLSDAEGRFIPCGLSGRTANCQEFLQ